MSGASRGRLSDAAVRDACDFLYEEAAALDEGRMRDWLAMLTDDIVYRMPVRVTREKAGGNGFSSDLWHFDENRFRLTKRVERLETEYAWAEDPPSRTRHHVTNVRARAGATDDEMVVTSNLLLYRSRGDTIHADLLSAEREDVLRRIGGAWKLAKREIRLDQSTLGTHNLAVFL